MITADGLQEDIAGIPQGLPAFFIYAEPVEVVIDKETKK
jgi:hypothetical protein